MPRQVVLMGSTDTLLSYPKLRPVDSFALEQPAAATAKVLSPGVPAPDVQAATRDTLSAVVETDAVEGDRTLVVADAATWVRGRRYLLDLSTGEQLVVKAAAGGTGTTLRLASPLPCDVPATSTVKGFAVSVALTADDTALETQHALVQWTATIGGMALPWAEEFAIVRRMPRWELDAEELVKRLPDVLGDRSRDDVDLSETIEGALEEELLPRLRGARKIREEDIISTWPLVPAHVAAVALFLARNDSSKAEAYREELRVELEQKLDLAIADLDAWYDAPQEETPQPTAEREDFTGYGYTR